MNSSPAIAVAAAVTVAPGFHQRAVINAFKQMQNGALRLTLPDGSVERFGTEDAENEPAHICVLHERFFKRCVLFGDVGFGESYVDGDWDTDDITRVIAWFIQNIDDAPSLSGSRAKSIAINLLGWQNRLAHLFRGNTETMSRRNIAQHYDLGNDFYKCFLDPTMTYSSALFQRPQQTLRQAQLAKYERLCRQLQLKPGDHVLEIGTGWGGFSFYAAKHYGVRLTTVTISQAQYNYAQHLFERSGLDHRIDLRLQDYRKITGQFDKIVSIEMVEAVGDRYLETYFAKCHEVLKPNGLLALQMITCPDDRYDSIRSKVDWIQKHIFPGSLLPSVHRVNQALRRTGNLSLHDMKDMGQSYAETLRRWRWTFGQNEGRVRKQGFDTAFIRKWNYYLSYCEAAFTHRNISVVQAVYSRPNNSTLAQL